MGNPLRDSFMSFTIFLVCLYVYINISQHLRWRIGSSVSEIFRTELSITYRMNSFLSNLDLACSSCSMNISISSNNSRLTSSYSAIRARTRSISLLRFLFLSKAEKWSLRSFSSYAMTRSNSFY